MYKLKIEYNKEKDVALNLKVSAKTKSATVTPYKAACWVSGGKYFFLYSVYEYGALNANVFLRIDRHRYEGWSHCHRRKSYARKSACY